MDKFEPENTELRNILQTKQDYFLTFYNQAWINYNLTKKFNELKQAEGNGNKQVFTEKLKTMFQNLHLTLIKSHVIHHDAKDIIEMCNALAVVYPPAANEAWAADVKIIAAFKYDEETQNKNREKVAEQYRALK